MLIKLTASFASDEQPDFEGLGITPSDSDVEDSYWDDLHVHYEAICSMYKNNQGTTNLSLYNGEKWSVKETPEEVNEKLSQLV